MRAMPDLVFKNGTPSMHESSGSITWFANAIDKLPSDVPVPSGTPGYNNYTTQKAHWLGWLNPSAGTGTYRRSGGKDRTARDVYNRIVEPKLLLWLVETAGVPAVLLDAAMVEAAASTKLATQSAAIRKHIPWDVLASALQLEMTERAN
jgi:hypothetical protein